MASPRSTWSPLDDEAAAQEPRGPRGGPPPFRGRPRPPKPSGDWIWGWHAVGAALANADREPPRRLMITAERLRELTAEGLQPPGLAGERLQTLESAEIGRRLPAGAVHQGIALDSPPPEPVDLEAFTAAPGAVLLMLDQVTDPQNVGAIFRTAAAFGALGVVLQDRHAPTLAGALAKAAAGAVDALPHAREVNLSRALERLTELGWRAVGLAGEAEQPLRAVLDGAPTVLVLGSEGEGLRRLVAEHCDALATIPMPGAMESLNVAAAAAVALYEATQRR